MRTAEASDLDESLDLETLREVIREHPVKLAILFGSHATGATHSASDIDLAVEFDTVRPPDPEYNDTYFGLSADLSDTLGTDAVDLVDLHSVSPAVAATVFDTGALLVGTQERVDELRRQLTASDDETQSPRDRFDSALAKIDAYFRGDDTEVPAAGDSDQNG